MNDNQKITKYLLKTSIIGTLMVQNEIKSDKELGELIDRKPSMVSLLMNRKVGASLDTIKNICNALHCEPWQIAEGFEPVPSNPSIVREGSAPYMANFPEPAHKIIDNIIKLFQKHPELKEIFEGIAEILDALEEKQHEKRMFLKVLEGMVYVVRNQDQEANN